MMKLELNILLKEIHSWKILLKRKDEEIQKLQNQLTSAFNKNKTLEDTRVTLLNEITQLNDALSTLHISVSRLQNSEVEKKTLLSEKENLKQCFNEREKVQQKEINELKKEVQKLKSAHQEEIKREILQYKSKTSSTLESYMNKISEKENEILKLQEELTKFKTEKHQEILKIQMECEGKLNKLKSRLTRGTHSFQDGFKKEDIFRQKYIQIEKESKEEISKLKKQIQELESQMAALKSSNPSINAQKIIPVNSTIFESEKFGGYLEECTHRQKRLKSDEHVDEGELSLFKANKMNLNHSNLVKPVKKKLFNLDSNYYGQ